MKLILHIGMHKTGTTALQASLAKNAKALRARGVLYPKAGRGPHPGHPHLPWSALGVARYNPRYGGLPEVVEEVRRARPDTVIVSAEDFTRRPERRQPLELAVALRDALAPSELAVVAYVRPQWEFLESAYTELVKNGMCLEHFDEFVTSHLDDVRFDYLRVFEPWRAAFEDALRVRAYRRDVVGDFWSLAGLGAAPAVERRNPRLGGRATEMLRSIREHLHESGLEQVVPVRDRFRECRAHLTTALAHDDAFRGLTEELRTQVAARYERSNRRFSTDYLGRPYEVAFPIRALPPPSTWSLSGATASEERTFETLMEIATRGT